MNIKETVDDIEFDALLNVIKEEKESDTYVKKAVDKIAKGANYSKISGLKGESYSPDIRQWRIEHNKLVGEAQPIRKSLLGGMGDKDKISKALSELRTKTSRIKALRSKIEKYTPKAAAKPEKYKVSRSRQSAAEKEAATKTAKKYEKMEKRTEWKRKVTGELTRQLANFGAIKRSK